MARGPIQGDEGRAIVGQGLLQADAVEVLAQTAHEGGEALSSLILGLGVTLPQCGMGAGTWVRDRTGHLFEMCIEKWEDGKGGQKHMQGGMRISLDVQAWADWDTGGGMATLCLSSPDNLKQDKLAGAVCDWRAGAGTFVTQGHSHAHLPSFASVLVEMKGFFGAWGVLHKGFIQCKLQKGGYSPGQGPTDSSTG